jgi:hypothetical protein
MYYSEYLVDIMGCVLNVGYVTNSHTTMMIHLYVTKKRKKEKKKGRHRLYVGWTTLGNVINSKNKMYFKNINPLENMHGFQKSIFDMDFVFFKKKKKGEDQFSPHRSS